MRRDLIADASKEARVNCDWVGNNAAFTCPVCNRVFLVSAMLHRNGRPCPGCERSTGHVTGGRNAGGRAFVEWSENDTTAEGGTLQMHDREAIRVVRQLFVGQSVDLPESPGVYAFWWVGPKADLMSANRHIVLKGPGGHPVDVEYRDWWPKELAYPCLYVGKSTNIKKRFSLHIKRNCRGRLHQAHPANVKAKPHTSSCQLRFGIEHVFPKAANPLEIIFRSVGFSCRTDFSENAIAERFLEEDRLVGVWRPWFNIDSER